MSKELDEDVACERLEGTTGKEKGGLVIMKKPSAGDSEQHVFKKPQMMGKSILGLDRIAAEKRQKLQADSDKSESNTELPKERLVSDICFIVNVNCSIRFIQCLFL